MITCDRSLKWVHLFVIPALKQVNSLQQPLHEACLEKIRILYRSLREYTEQPSEEKSIFFLNTFLKETLKNYKHVKKIHNKYSKNHIIVLFLYTDFFTLFIVWKTCEKYLFHSLERAGEKIDNKTIFYTIHFACFLELFFDSEK